jgi:hypothetical protein
MQQQEPKTTADGTTKKAPGNSWSKYELEVTLRDCTRPFTTAVTQVGLESRGGIDVCHRELPSKGMPRDYYSRVAALQPPHEHHEPGTSCRLPNDSICSPRWPAPSRRGFS